MAEIAGGNAVTKFQGRHPDQQVGERKTNAFCLVLAVDLSESQTLASLAEAAKGEDNSQLCTGLTHFSTSILSWV